jgi:hypothetical protein
VGHLAVFGHANMIRRVSRVVLISSLAACAELGEIRMGKMPWDHPSIAEVAPKAPMLPLVAPSDVLKGDKGPAGAPYPATFTATIKADGTVVFPEGAPGKLRGTSIVVGGGPVATLSADGEVSGNGLKRKYRFAPDGDLLDAEGHGLRLSPDGGVRAIGGPYHYKDVMVWATPTATPYDKPKPAGEAAPTWDRASWRAVLIVSLLMVENLLPEALGR